MFAEAIERIYQEISISKLFRLRSGGAPAFLRINKWTGQGGEGNFPALADVAKEFFHAVRRQSAAVDWLVVGWEIPGPSMSTPATTWAFSPWTCWRSRRG